ncbi:MAG: hypothetical protein AB7E81_07050 [Hyphomicrobiaceae bacterium]
MLALAVILLSTLLGLFGAPWWGAVGCGLVLATVATHERAVELRRAQSLRYGAAIGVTLGASVLLGQGTSVATYAVGRLLSGLLLI